MSVPSISSGSTVYPVPTFAFIDQFHASSTLTDKVYRVANHALFGAAVYGAYAFLRGQGSLLWGAALALAARKMGAVGVGYAVYPSAALTRTSGNYRGRLIRDLDRGLDQLKKAGFTTRRVTLIKSGVSYDGVMAGSQDTLANGRWALHALGNGMSMESSLQDVALENCKRGCNTLVINGPSVGRSGGVPTKYQMGAGFEAGLQYLEGVVRATHVVMDGFSLGNGMMSEAILQHDFTKGLKDGTRYLAISDRSFSRLSDIAAAIVGIWAKPAIRLLGADLDGMAGARKLSELGIRHIIVQHKAANPSQRQSDGVIPDAVSLAEGIHAEKRSLEGKRFHESNRLGHNSPAPADITTSIRKEVREFLQAG